MSLKQLFEIERSATANETENGRHESAMTSLAMMRNGPHSLTGAITDVFGGWRYGGDEIAKLELYSVINEMKADIYRIAEMRLAAKARFYKVSAAQKRAIITSSILPLPDMDQEQAS